MTSLLGIRWNEVKEHYRDRVPPSTMYDLNEELVRVVMSYSPRTVLDFGCGSGKILAALERKGLDRKDMLGVDVSDKALDVARELGLEVFLGDEGLLETIPNRHFGVVTTTSVLDHIEDVRGVVEDLKRIAIRAVVIAECSSAEDVEKNQYFFDHDYEGMGFSWSGYSFFNCRDGNRYEIWEMVK